jgi:OmpA-OmpF porin, OOP family
VCYFLCSLTPVKEESCSLKRSLGGYLRVGASILAGCLAWCSGEGVAAAQYFTVDRMLPSGAPDDGFMVYRPRLGKTPRIYVNGLTGFAADILRDESVTSDPAANRALGPLMYGQFPLHLSGGIELGRFSFNLALPFYPLQIPGKDPATQNVGKGGIANAWAGVGDPRLDARWVAYTSRDRKTSFGAVGGFTIPIGTESTFGGDQGWTALLLATFEQDFGPFALSVNLGPHFKPTMGIGGQNGDLTISNELRYTVGAFLPLKKDVLRLGLELWGSTNLGSEGQAAIFGGRNTTLEWLAQARLTLDKAGRYYMNFGGGTRLSAGYGAADVRLLASFGTYFHLKDFDGKAPRQQQKVIVSKPEYYDVDSDADGYPDSIDKCTGEKEDHKGTQPSDGCPAPPDQDEDGILDKDDKCPTSAEDKDDIQDEDGCPESDADSDKISDDDDACPEEPGPPNDNEELHGCPTLTKVSEDGSVEILTPIEFALGTATVQPASLPIVDEVVTLMAARPELRIAVHGHTDDKGSRPKNLRLSQDRAASVRKYMESKGIDPSRLESAGFGPDKPIDSNATAAGRAKNRRVEFVVLNQPAELKKKFTE